MQQTNDLNALRGLGEPAKDTTPAATNRVRLAALRGYLRGLPGLDFSDKGRATICRRFNVSDDELSTAVAGLQQPRTTAPTPALLRTIGEAVGHRAIGGEGSC